MKKTKLKYADNIFHKYLCLKVQTWTYGFVMLRPKSDCITDEPEGFIYTVFKSV